MKEKPDIKDLKRLSPSRWVMDAVLNWFIIGLAIYVAGQLDHLFFYWLATLLIGTRQHAISILGHDGAHRLVSRNRKLNDFLTNLLSFWPLGAPLDAYRKFHFSHHVYVGTDKDPELKHKLWGSPEWDLPRSKSKRFYYLIKDLAGLSSLNLFTLFSVVAPPKKWMVIFPNLMPWTISLFFILTGNIYVVLLWYFSLMTSFWAAFRLRIWSEHMGTSQTHRIKVPFWMTWIFAPVNTWYHWEHHKWPSVPYWNLPKARSLDDRTPVLELKDLDEMYAKSNVIRSGHSTG